MAQHAVKQRYRYGMWNRYFLSILNTRLAYPWTRLFVLLRLTPNQVSLLSLFVSIAGMAVIALAPAPLWRAGLGGLLLMVGIWWDHSDGQVARLTGQGSSGGALLDTVIDRWVESGWLLALGLGLLYSGTPQAREYPPWFVLSVVSAAIFANFYVRWSNLQKDLYILRESLKAAAADSPAHELRVATPPRVEGPGDVRMFWIPFSFNRDVSFWILFAITWTPYWIEGLLVFTALHGARALEVNWYTFQGVRHGDPEAVARFVHPDYHK